VVEVRAWDDGTGATVALPSVGARMDLGPASTRIVASDTATRRRLQRLLVSHLGVLS
jgi:hypothetical protein